LFKEPVLYPELLYSGILYCRNAILDRELLIWPKKLVLCPELLYSGTLHCRNATSWSVNYYSGRWSKEPVLYPELLFSDTECCTQVLYESVRTILTVRTDTWFPKCVRFHCVPSQPALFQSRYIDFTSVYYLNYYADIYKSAFEIYYIAYISM